MKTRIQQKVFELFDLNEKYKSPKGWITSPKACPWCGKDGHHLGFKMTVKTVRHNNEVSFNCFKCGVKGGEFLLFKQLNQLDFLKQGDYIKREELIEKRTIGIEEEEEVLDLSVPKRHKPLGFKRVSSDDYLISRGFEDWQFEQYIIGRTRLTAKLKDYVIFLITEDGENKGYVARITWSKEKIVKYEKDTGKKVIRYRNEGGVDFARLLFGLEEIDENTVTVILVEGVTDKANIDRHLRVLGIHGEVKCCCTFGKKISNEQVEKLRLKGVPELIFLYDPDAVESSKQHSMRVKRKFRKVSVGFLKDQDPGDLSLQNFKNVLQQLEDPINFSINRVQKRILED